MPTEEIREIKISDDAMEIECPNCLEVLIEVPKGKTKMSMYAELSALRAREKKLARLGFFERLFLWRHYFNDGGKR